MPSSTYASTLCSAVVSKSLLTDSVHLTLIHSTVYTNSLLAMLNARNNIRGANVDTEGFDISMPTLATTTFGGTRVRLPRTNFPRAIMLIYDAGSQSARNNTLTVMVETTKECDNDNDDPLEFKSGEHCFREPDGDVSFYVRLVLTSLTDALGSQSRNSSEGLDTPDDSPNMAHSHKDEDDGHVRFHPHSLPFRSHSPHTQTKIHPVRRMHALA